MDVNKQGCKMQFRGRLLRIMSPWTHSKPQLDTPPNPAVGPLRWCGNACYCLTRSELIVTSEPECFRYFSHCR